MEVQTAESGVLLACGHCFSSEALSEYIRTEVLESQVREAPPHTCHAFVSSRRAGWLGRQGPTGRASCGTSLAGRNAELARRSVPVLAAVGAGALPDARVGLSACHVVAGHGGSGDAARGR